MPAVKGQQPKKRNRKRKRRQAFPSSSSSSSDSGSEDETATQTSPVIAKQTVAEKVSNEDSESTSSTSSSSDTETSSSDNDIVNDGDGDVEMKTPPTKKPNLPSRSPSPVDPKIPSNIFLNPSNEEERQKDEQMRERFRKYWMKSMAEGFGEELEQIQKVSHLTIIVI
jgi:ribosome assembly protein 3